MTKHLSSLALPLLIAAGMILAPTACSAATRPSSIEAGALALVDAETGVVLFQRNMHQPRPTASTTKIMTALLALEHSRLDDSVIVSPAATQVEGSSLYLKPGDLMRMDDLLTALLLKSANDSALVIAEHISGTSDAFADLMNERARQLGATHSHFVNPHGLHHPDHYSCAYDLALITREALKHARFRELVATQKAKILVPSDPSGVRPLNNHNKLLRTADFVDGVKTGYVSQSGHCLVASATKDGWQLIAVLLDCPEAYDGALRLFEYGFGAFRQRVYAQPGDALGRAAIRGGAQPSVPAVCPEALTAVVGPNIPAEPELHVTLKGPLRAPVSKDEPVGEVRLIADGEVLSHAPLLAAQTVPPSLFRIVSLWGLRVILFGTLGALFIRHYAKFIKANRRRRMRFPP